MRIDMEIEDIFWLLRQIGIIIVSMAIMIMLCIPVDIWVTASKIEAPRLQPPGRVEGWILAMYLDYSKDYLNDPAVTMTVQCVGDGWCRDVF